jgi:RNA polymerase sigma-70 factor (ECF subfamily)
MRDKLNLTPQQEYDVVQASLKDPSEFRAIYELYYKDIFRFIYSRINDSNVTADLTSTVFFKAITKLETFKFIGHSIKSWIMRIAYNEMMQFFRQENKHRIVSIEEQEISQLAAEVDDNPNLSMEDLKPFLDQLEDDDLTLLELKYFDKSSYKEIGTIMNLSESNARVKLHRVIKRLQQTVRKEIHNEQ